MTVIRARRLPMSRFSTYGSSLTSAHGRSRDFDHDGVTRTKTTRCPHSAREDIIASGEGPERGPGSVEEFLENERPGSTDFSPCLWCVRVTARENYEPPGFVGVVRFCARHFRLAAACPLDAARSPFCFFYLRMGARRRRPRRRSPTALLLSPDCAFSGFFLLGRLPDGFPSADELESGRLNRSEARQRKKKTVGRAGRRCREFRRVLEFRQLRDFRCSTQYRPHRPDRGC